MCCVGSHNRRRLLLYTTLADWFCITEVQSVYCTVWGESNIQSVPLATEPGIFFNNSNNNEDIATKFEQEYVLVFHISYTMR
jgi:hypothetical protein